jgi:O-acetylserine/cysteine efflux transporter
MLGIRPRHLFFLVLICVLWAFNLVAVKTGLAQFPAVFFAFARLAILAALLAPLLRVHRGQMRPLITAAALCGAVSFGLLFYGISLTDDIAAVAIATQLGLPFTTLLSVLLLGEKVRWRRWLGVALSFLGVMIMGFEPQALGHGVALLFVTVSAFTGALGLIVMKRVVGVKPLELQAWFATASWPVLLMATLLLEKGQWQAVLQATPVAWAALAFVTLGSSLVAHTGYYYLIQRYPVSSVAPLTVLSPLFSVVFSVTLLGSALTGRLVLGGAITLLGVVIIAAREKKIIDTGG